MPANLMIVTFFLLNVFIYEPCLAFLISEYSGKISIGFGSVGVIYFNAGMTFYVGRNTWLKRLIANSVVNNMLNHELK
jgi:hypothetical protein